MDIIDLYHVMQDEELKLITGGVGLSATVVNAIVRVISFSLELGRTLGTIIRRYQTKNMC